MRNMNRVKPVMMSVEEQLYQTKKEDESSTFLG